MLGGVILAILSVSIISAKGLEWCLYTKYSIRPDTTIHGSRPMTSIPDDVRIDFYFTSSSIEILSREIIKKMYCQEVQFATTGSNLMLLLN